MDDFGSVVLVAQMFVLSYGPDQCLSDTFGVLARHGFLFDEEDSPLCREICHQAQRVYDLFEADASVV